MICVSLRNRIHNWLRDYVRLQSFVVILIYAQIGCALIGSLGALYNGVLLINLAIALFGLVAIESNSQKLGRTYAVLLFCGVLLDVSWFILFSKEIWNLSSEMYQAFYIFSVKLTMAMEIAGFVVRISSSLLWFQIYRLGSSVIDTSFPRQSDSDLRNSFLEPPLFARQRSRDPESRNSFLEPPAIPKPRSRSDDFLGDSADEPAFYTPLLDGCQSNITTPDITQVVKYHAAGDIYKGSPSSAAEASRNKSPFSRSLEALDSSLR
ncbi:PREDICTED: uncharacterized protein LOC104765117 [Camelina sativa]|uniref:Uncharacterized protein LOC104765117 n=1 Tax=Camelina sativa TaxID=90675 RepID=A0ABM0XJZ7_CAMSA|nr:PREDICTED: uncharacterized protein LOC104765117 [Camelina sativa]XP_010487096.1 PREDICTED: uncharacterized protein LOC104765117 [Camelina sativa]